MTEQFDPVAFGKAVAAQVREIMGPMQQEIESLRAQVKALEAREPLKGEPGPPGDPGKDAPPVELDISDVVRQILSSDQLRTLVNLEVAAYLEENPPAPGRDGKDGEPGQPGKSVTIDDVSVFLDAAVSRHVLDIERRAGDAIQRAIDKLPAPKDGKDGRDGVAMPTVEWDGERTVTVKAASGEVLQVVKLSIPLDRGYYRDGMSCEKGDVTTHDGIAWIALRDTKAKPSIAAKEDWRILARKGRDGDRGPKGQKGEPPAPVKVGDDK